MSAVGLISQIYGVLTTFPGNLTYHLVTAFAIAGAAYAAMLRLRSGEHSQPIRPVIGLTLLLALRLVIFGLMSIGEELFSTPESYLPLLDRALSALSILIIGWLWAFPDRSRLADAASILLGLLVLTSLAFSLVIWSNQLAVFSDQSNLIFFNQTPLSAGWEVLSLGLASLGIFLLILRQPSGWSIGLGTLGILFAGHLLQLTLPELENNFPGAVRLAELAAFPLLLTLSQHIPTREAIASFSASQSLTVERRNHRTEPEAFRAFVALTNERNPASICIALTRAVAHLMRADLCLLVTPPDEEGELSIECGYDLIRQQSFRGTSLDEDSLPILAAALRRGKPLRLPASSTSPDLYNLAQALGLDKVGHLVAAPITMNGDQSIAGIVLLSPYSNRGWQGEDQNYLVELTGALTQIARQNSREGLQAQELEEALDSLNFTQDEIARLEQEKHELEATLKAYQNQTDQEPVSAESLAELLAAQEEAQEIIQRLQEELKRRGALPMIPTTETGQLAGELRQALEEGPPGQTEVTLQGLPSESRADDQPPGGQNNHANMIASIAQDIRQPMSSISGYTDMLLNESVGILGTLQIKFLERIKASVERMHSLLDDLVQITALDGSHANIRPQAVDLSVVIDDALEFTRAQLSENHIILRVDLPENLPEIQADRDALLQILIHLIQNAGSVTPMDGEVALRVRVEGEPQDPRVLIQVSDSGGGIPEEDLPRVFSRLYRADNTLIEGVGDTGVGLAIAKALVEAHQGQIWVDTEPGQGSRFSALIPLRQPEWEDPTGGGPIP